MQVILDGADPSAARAAAIVALAGSPRTVTLSADRSRLEPGESATVSAHVTGADGRPVPDGALVAFAATPRSMGGLAPEVAATARGVARTFSQAAGETTRAKAARWPSQWRPLPGRATAANGR